MWLPIQLPTPQAAALSSMWLLIQLPSQLHNLQHCSQCGCWFSYQLNSRTCSIVVDVVADSVTISTSQAEAVADSFTIPKPQSAAQTQSRCSHVLAANSKVIIARASTSNKHTVSFCRQCGCKLTYYLKASTCKTKSRESHLWCIIISRASTCSNNTVTLQ